MIKSTVSILVVDDDPEIIELLKLDMELMGFNVDAATDGATGLRKAEAKRYDLILLDVMMPKMDGFELTKRLRANKLSAETPIILLTAKGTIEDKIRGFNAGSDDYLVKPFEFQELMVRMRALFRRTGKLTRKPDQPSDVQPSSQQKEDITEMGDIKLVPTSLEVLMKGRLVKLTPTEFEILFCLMQHANEAVTLAVLLKEVWGYDADEDVRMLRVHVGGLRQKIEDDHKHPQYLETVTNVGYRLNPAGTQNRSFEMVSAAKPAMSENEMANSL